MWEIITVCDHLNEKWEKEGKVRMITPEDVLKFYGVKNYKASGGSYICVTATQRRFFDLNLAGQTWNDNIIWVKGNCLQRDDEEPLEIRFRTVKQSVKSKVERKESLLNEVAEEETELELVLEGLCLSRKKGGEVAKDKRRRGEPSGESGGKVVEGRSAVVDDLKEVEERARLAVLHGEEDTRKMAAKGFSCRGDWSATDGDKANLHEMVEEHDILGCHLMLKGYSEEEVDAIKADTYVEEEDEEEAEAVGIVDGLDNISRQAVLGNQGDDVELSEGGSEKAIKEMSLRIKGLESGLAWERETFKSLLSAQPELQVELDSSRSLEDDVLKCDPGRFDLILLVEEKDAEINKGLKELTEVTERGEKLQRQVDALAVKGDVVSLSGQIRELDSNVSRIQGHVQKGNVNLRECQHKLDVALIREKVLEGEIKAKESLVKRKEELLKDILAREELNAEIQRLHARVVDLEAMYLAESAKYTKKLEENVIYHAKAIDAYFIEEVKRLESERDILFKTLSDKGCICGAKIDRGNCMGIMETQLDSRTAELIESGRAAMIRELKVQPLDVGGSTADSPSAEKKPL
ncbi:hypothetical protein GIB67_025527 [Kingdonia uniflora]|uniref:Uncharacterized protein n=1 Tax=Kingdonia uniflora TaxID=39325 RepID=A0A7J7M0J9_9MAGN|nr:hypothetical protein GIB67_025527 [Kingdonia uniflora]